jgi:hypothetical protein
MLILTGDGDLGDNVERQLERLDVWARNRKGVSKRTWMAAFKPGPDGSNRTKQKSLLSGTLSLLRAAGRLVNGVKME